MDNKMRVLSRDRRGYTYEARNRLIIDGRMGALRARLETAHSRVLAWAYNQADESLAELKEPVLPYLQRPGGLAGYYGWADIVSACR